MKRWLVVLMSAALLLGAACGDDDGGGETAGGENGKSEAPASDDAPSGDSGGGELTISAVDFAFELPSTATAGKTDIVFENNGKEPHELVMVGLSEDAPPVNELIELPEKKAEEFFTGQPISSEGPIGPGETKDISAELEPGTYGLVCFVESKKEKQPHAFLGMINSLTVQ